MNTASFLVTKLVWLVVRPDNLLVIFLLVGAGLLQTPWGKWGKKIIWGVAIVLCAISFLPIGEIMMGALEDRFQPPATIPENIEGVIVLGGAIESDISADRNAVAFNAAAERLTQMIPLLAEHPKWKMIFTSGSGYVLDQTHREADVAKRFFQEMGLANGERIFERNSRNTYENAVEVAKLIPAPRGKPWLLVTSAFHMPRSMGTFRKAGLNVIAYPVDYRTMRSRALRFSPGLFYSAESLQPATKEWAGLIAYYLMGRTTALFPN